jgi:hypothetical protein
MDQQHEILQSSVGFLYKTMLERDPRKRRIKPVEPHLLQLDFTGLDDSSDDSDFKLDKDGNADDNDADDVDNDDDDNDDDDESVGDVDCVDDDVQLFDESDGDHSSDLVLTNDGGNAMTGSCMNLDTVVDITTTDRVVSSNQRTLKVLVCSICLDDHSEKDNEIVECDSCGASVHEGCYGITELESVDSSVSSASTEPWFCDACKAGVKPHCELCPNIGGIFKETDTNRWVHLVCALYVPGVAFGDIDKLTNVTLFEMSYTKWGTKECSLCIDEKLRRTGVCICCDAGMCRTYFHVTCAQREGLLTEASPDEEIADPFFAYCKQHSDKQQVTVKRRNWLAVQSSMKNFENHLCDKDKLRVQRKLTVHQQRFSAVKDQQETTWVPTAKMPRMLITSAHALEKLLKKAELLGVTQVDPVADVQKKWYISPTLSIDYVGYYIDRNVRICNLKHHVKELHSQKSTLENQESALHNKYEQLLKDVLNMQSSNSELQEKGELLWNTVNSLASRRLRWSGAVYFQQYMKLSPKKSNSSSCPSIFSRCDTCKKTHNQHLLVKCDLCHKQHHLGCLDPPLTRMPKKTKLQGWHCSTCVGQSSSSEDNDNIADEPRRLRNKYLIREPTKYSSLFVNPIRKRHRQFGQSCRLQSLKSPASVALQKTSRHSQRQQQSVQRNEAQQLVYKPTINSKRRQHWKAVKSNMKSVKAQHLKKHKMSTCPQSTDTGDQPQLIAASAVTDREFYYSSRQDPMRQKTLLSTSAAVIEISDDDFIIAE